MAADSSAFSCLPLAVRDSILQQAFQQLDQQHLVGVAPRVCRLWHQLSLSIINSLVAKIGTAEGAEQLSLWMQNHGAGLDTLNLQVFESAQSLFHAFGAAEQLCTVTLASTSWYQRFFNVALHPLTNLTRLGIGSSLPTAPVIDSILGLTLLESLSISAVVGGHNWQHLVPQLATRLIKLTNLELSDMGQGARPATLNHLRSLPDLKDLQVCVVPDSELPLMGRLPITSAHFRVSDESQLGNLNAWLEDAPGCLQLLWLMGSYSGSYSGSVAVCAHGLHLHIATQLKSLGMRRVQPDTAEVAALTNLTSLMLGSCGLDDAAVCKLSTLCSLRELSLWDNNGVVGADGSMEVLASSMPHLTKLCLRGTSAQEAAQLVFGERVVDWPEHRFLEKKGSVEAAAPS